MKFHHIGIACKNISSEIGRIRAIYDVTSASIPVYDKLQDAILCFVETKNGISIELISGPIVQHLIERGIQYYHLCFTVRNIDATANKLIKSGGVIVRPPQPAILFNSSRVAFIYTRGGLIELLEEG